MRDFITEWGKACFERFWNGKEFPHISPVKLKRNRQAFRAAVHRYPVHAPPHPGLGHQITDQQAQANLDWFRASVPQRLAAMDSFLAEFGVPAAPCGATWEEVEIWIARVIAWTHDYWPDKPFRPEHGDEDVWQHAPRVGDEAIFSIALDLGTRFGEVAISMEPRWRWGLNMDRSDLRDMMLSSRRVVMTTAPLGPKGLRPFKDWEKSVVGCYLSPNAIFYRIGPPHHHWASHLDDACMGQPIKRHQEE